MEKGAGECVCVCVGGEVVGVLNPVNNTKDYYNRGPSGLIFTRWRCYGLCPRHKKSELAHSFYSVLVSISGSMALSTVFRSITSSDNSSLAHFVHPVLFLPYWSCPLCISL